MKVLKIFAAPFISLGKTFGTMFGTKTKVSPLQMSLTILQVTALVLSNILVVKSIDLFGQHWLATSCAILTFPVTYILSDVFSEVYGYRWSRVSGTWAMLGTVLASCLFALSIKIPGSQDFVNQAALEAILGNTPKIAIASVLAFWVGDIVDDLIFQKMKKKFPSDKAFGFRAIISSIGGKYVDQIIFTFIGLSFLPMETKIIMVINCPLVQLAIETILLPITYRVKAWVVKAENKYLVESN